MKWCGQQAHKRSCMRQHEKFCTDSMHTSLCRTPEYSACSAALGGHLSLGLCKIYRSPCKSTWMESTTHRCTHRQEALAVTTCKHSSVLGPVQGNSVSPFEKHEGIHHLSAVFPELQSSLSAHPGLSVQPPGAQSAPVIPVSPYLALSLSPLPYCPGPDTQRQTHEQPNNFSNLFWPCGDYFYSSPTYLLKFIQPPLESISIQAQLFGFGLGLSNHFFLLKAAVLSFIPWLSHQPQLLF